MVIGLLYQFLQICWLLWGLINCQLDTVSVSYTNGHFINAATTVVRLVISPMVVKTREPALSAQENICSKNVKIVKINVLIA